MSDDPYTGPAIKDVVAKVNDIIANAPTQPAVANLPDSTESVVVDSLRDIPDDGFTLNNKRLLLTYRSHIDKEALNLLFSTKGQELEFFRAAHETADKSNPYEHTHVVVVFKKALQSKNSRVFDIKGIHPNIRALKTVTHFKNACVYLCKEDHTNDDLALTKINKVEAIWEQPTLHEALKFANVNEANNVMTLYNNKPKDRIAVKKVKLVYWQVNFAIELLKVIEVSDDDEESEELVWVNPNSDKNTIPYDKIGRQITVVYDPKGKNGKTELVKYLVRKDPKRFFAIQGLGQARDAMEAIKNALNSGWNGETLLITFPRQCADHKIYESLECFIDGFGTTQKYSGTTLEWPVKRVVVFSNFMLDLPKMTMDRWDIRKINDETKFFDIISTRQALEIYKHEHDERMGKNKTQEHNLNWAT